MNSAADATVFLGLTVIYGIALLICLVVALAPFLIAVMRGHPNSVPILLVVIFFGWTFIGWFLALVWSFTSTETGSNITVVNSYRDRDYRIDDDDYETPRRRSRSTRRVYKDD